MSDELVSILICAYNTSQYVERCISSIVKQSYRYLEIHILDNGSVDNTWDVINKFKDERIHLYRVENNIGVEKGYQMLLDHTSGNFFLYVDSDDFLEKNSIQKLVDYMSKYEQVDMIFFNHYRYYSESNIQKCAFKGSQINVISGPAAIKHIFDPWGIHTFEDNINLCDFGSHWGTMYRGFLAKEVNRKVDFAVGYYADFCYILDNCLKSRKCMIVEDCLYYLNRDGNSTTGSNLADWRMEEFLQAIDYMFEKIKKIEDYETKRVFAEFVIDRAHDLICDFDDKVKSRKYYGVICRKQWFKTVKRWYTSSLKKKISYKIYFVALPLYKYKNLRMLL